MSKILVTGGSGFIGSHLIDALVAAGHGVASLDVAPAPAWANEHAEYIEKDIRDADLAEVFARVQPEFVFHLAAHVDDRDSVLHPAENAEHNVLGSVNVFNAAQKAGTKKVIFTSTGVVYGVQSKLPIAEDALPAPLTPYAVGKLTGERYLNYFKAQHGLDFCALRLGNIYGPRQDGSKECGAIAIFTNKLMRGEAPFMNGDGTTTRDYVHVADVVRACLLAMQPEAQGVFNVGTGIQTATKDLYALITGELGVNTAPTPRPEVADQVRYIALDPAKASRNLGFAAEIDLAAGVRETIDWYKKH